MICTKEYILQPGTVVKDESGMELLARAINGDHPTDVCIRWNNFEIEQAGFAGSRFSPVANRLMPHCDLVRWHGITIAIGLFSLVIASMNALDVLNLFRNHDEDAGFYQLSWLDDKTKLLGIYEGGFFLLSDRGSVVWHIDKNWDDIFVSANENDLLFIGYNKIPFHVDKITGQRRL